MRRLGVVVIVLACCNLGGCKDDARGVSAASDGPMEGPPEDAMLRAKHYGNAAAETCMNAVRQSVNRNLTNEYGKTIYERVREDASSITFPMQQMQPAFNDHPFFWINITTIAYEKNGDGYYPTDSPQFPYDVCTFEPDRVSFIGLDNFPK